MGEKRPGQRFSEAELNEPVMRRIVLQPCSSSRLSGRFRQLIGKPGADGHADGGFAIEQVTTAKALEEYLDAYVAGWDFPEKDHAQFKSNVRPWLEQAGWSLYLARVNGQPAAAATLYVLDDVGYLADSATDPSFRRRGVHVALLRRRMRDAGVSGADLVFSGAEPFSSSHRNMERVGMRLQFTRAKWTLAS
jgi:hypothetical protein